jgi:hypothetical protein
VIRCQPNTRGSIDQTSTLKIVLPLKRLLGSALQVGDKVVSLLRLLHSGEGHLGSGNVLFGILEVVELGAAVSRLDQDAGAVSIDTRRTYQSILAPGDAFGLVGIRVGEAGDLASLPTEETVQLRSDFVTLAST